MSNKLHKEELKIHNKFAQRFRVILLAVLSIAFFAIWLDIAHTSRTFTRQLENMEEGKDYFIEDICIIKKDYDSYYPNEDSSVASTNYYFYYGNSFNEKLHVNKETYGKYQIGDRVPAYTTDHVSYYFSKEGLLPEYQNNEMKKCVGVLLGVSVIFLSILVWTERK